MYASIRRYRLGAGSMEDLMARVDTLFAERLPAELGALLYQAIDTGEGMATTITLFEDEAHYRRAAPAMEDVRQRLSELGFAVERIEVLDGEVRVSRASEALLPPVHP